MQHQYILCPLCGQATKRYDHVKRMVRTAYGRKYRIFVERYCCCVCGCIHRILPEFLLPYKHYEKTVVAGFVSGLFTSDDLAYEDYPCEQTVKRWKDLYFSTDFNLT